MTKRLIFFFITILAGCCLAKASLAGSRPNIILVMTDDQGYGDLSCHGHPFLETPNLDKLYGQSTCFTDFHVSPTCAPTRAALLSGRAPFKNGVTHTILERERMTLKAVTIAEVLKSAGYRSGIFGKWHLGDADPYQPDSRGFDETFIHAAGGIGQNFPGTQGAIPGTGYFDPFIKHNGRIVKTSGYCTDVFFQEAMGWIKKCQQEKQPFFAYIPTNAPHGPFIVADKYQKPFEGKVKDKATRAFFGMIVNIDENMGRLMAKLEEWNMTRAKPPMSSANIRRSRHRCGRPTRHGGKKFAPSWSMKMPPSIPANPSWNSIKNKRPPVGFPSGKSQNFNG